MNILQISNIFNINIKEKEENKDNDNPLKKKN